MTSTSRKPTVLVVLGPTDAKSSKTIKVLQDRTSLDVVVIYRDYHFSLDGVDVVMGNGLCYTRDADGMKMPIRFPKSRRDARKARIAYVRLNTLFNPMRLVSPETAIARLERAARRGH